MLLQTLNSDWSNRHPSINTIDKLCAEIVQIYSVETDFLSLQEIKPTALKKLKNEGLTFENAKIGYDHIALFYNEQRWTPWNEFTYSNVGKYLGAIFCNENNEKIAIIAVHLPTKCKAKKQAAHRCLKDFAQELENRHDLISTCIIGDFNTEPDELAQNFDTFNLAFNLDDPPTTAAGQRLDNVLFSDQFDSCSLSLRTPSVFTHYPATVELY